MLSYNRGLKHNSRKLRKNMTDAEGLLWSRIRRKQLNGLQFYRQKPIGNYIVDFYCPRAKMVIEVDGSQHYTDEGFRKDNIRDNYMKMVGLRVLRFSARDVMKHLDGVLEEIYQEL